MSGAAHHQAPTLRRGRRIRCTGAILAGGASSRMGRPKQDMLLANGRPMIECVHEAVAHVCERVVVLGESARLPQLQRIADLRPGCGPLGGIEALLASGLDENYLVVPCDVPLVSAELLEALLIETDRPATTFDGHPLPACLSAHALPIVQRMLNDGEQAVWRLMEEVGAERVALQDGWVGLLANVNTPEDLQRVARRAAR